MSLFDTLGVVIAGSDAVDSVLKAMDRPLRQNQAEDGIPYVISELADGATLSAMAKLKGMSGPDSQGTSPVSHSTTQSLYNASATLIQAADKSYGSLLDTFDTESDGDCNDSSDGTNSTGNS